MVPDKERLDDREVDDTCSIAESADMKGSRTWPNRTPFNIFRLRDLQFPIPNLHFDNYSDESGTRMQKKTVPNLKKFETLKLLFLEPSRDKAF